MSNMLAALSGLMHHPRATDFPFAELAVCRDQELELVHPSSEWIDGVLAACTHPLTLASDPEHAATTRTQLEQLLRSCHLGRDPGDMTVGRVPTYNFWLRLRPEYDPPVAIAGNISLRIGQTADILLFFGHVGYNVYPPARGHHYAGRACRLLFPLARHHGLKSLWVTTDPTNLASRRTCEALGGVMVDVVDVPADHVLYRRGQKRKCRYRIDLD